MPTLKELLEKGESFKYGTDYRKVESDKDTLLEFETQGIRPKFTIRQPLLYGTQTLRITRRSTNILDDMKENRNNQGGEGGLLTNFISDAKDTLNDFASTLGIPTLQIPTRVSDELKESPQSTEKLLETLAEIRKSGEGKLLGQFLKQNAQGTPKQIGRQAIGGGLSLAKSELRNAVFGVGGEPNLSPTAEDTINSKNYLGRTNYSNLKLYSKTIEKRGLGVFDGDGGGLYTVLDTIQDRPSLYNDFLNSKNNDTSYANPQSKQVEPNFPSFPEFSPNLITQNIPAKIDKTYTKSNSKIQEVRIDKDKIGKFRTKSDFVNLYGVWDGDGDGNPTEQIVDNKTIDDLDFVPLRFLSVAKNKGVSFKATVNGISENFSPAWEGSNFLGNPYTFYTYQTMDRDLTFSFSVYALSSEEHKSNWEKLDFLTSLVYPQNTNINDVYVTPPLVKVTMGNMYKNKLGFIESLSYTIDDNTPWEIGYTLQENGTVSESGDMKNYKLPRIINVAVSYQIIETSSDVVGKKLYPYGTSMIYGQK